ncbi:MAG: PilW family protein [Pseudomonadales bacterium]
MKQRRILNRQQGFSLIEMLLAMALGLIVVTGIVQLFIGNSQSARVISGQARLQENARFAFEFISRAARQAGYFGCIRDPQTRVWGLNGLPNQLPEYNIDQPVGGFNASGGGTWAPAVVNLPGVAGSTIQGGNINVATLQDGADILVFRNLRQPVQKLTVTLNPTDNPVVTAPGNTLNFGADEIAMVADCEQASVFRVTGVNIAANEATLQQANGVGGPNAFFQNAVNMTPPTGPQVPRRNSFLNRPYGPEAVVGAIESTFFFIADSTRQNESGDTPLALWQKVGPGAPVELIQGVQDMQVLFGIDTTLNDDIPNPNQYVTANLIPDPTQVVAIQVSLTVDSIDRVTEDNNLLTRTFTKTILVRNANPEL